jgi:hypothetical protein
MSVKLTLAGSSAPVRRISVAVFIGIVILYLGVLQVVGRLATVGLHESFRQFTSTEEVARGLLLPVGLSLILVYGFIALLGWTRPVFVDDRHHRALRGLLFLFDPARFRGADHPCRSVWAV